MPRPTKLGITTLVRAPRVALACGLAVVIACPAPPARAGVDTARLTSLAQHAGYRLGTASWYGATFAGQRTASGRAYDPHALVAASQTLPLGSWVRVLNLTNGLACMVQIVDRGPIVDDRVLDLSRGAAEMLHMVDRGVTPVAIGPVGDLPASK